MEWINLNTAVIDSPEFAMAEPVQMGTWLRLLRYCAGQENGGRITNAKNWPARVWWSCARVLPEEVAACSLWTWEADDLVVRFYPAEREKQVKNARTAGFTGGTAKTQAKTQASATNGLLGGRPKRWIHEENHTLQPNNPSDLTETTQAKNPSKTQNNPTEEKRREEKVKESPPAREPGFTIPSEAELLTFASGFSKPAIGAGRIPEEWILGWFAWRMENPATFPPDWQAAAARRFTVDFQNRHPKALGQKKSAGPGAASAFAHEIQSPVKIPLATLPP